MPVLRRRPCFFAGGRLGKPSWGSRPRCCPLLDRRGILPTACSRLAGRLPKLVGASFVKPAPACRCRQPPPSASRVAGVFLPRPAQAPIPCASAVASALPTPHNSRAGGGPMPRPPCGLLCHPGLLRHPVHRSALAPAPVSPRRLLHPPEAGLQQLQVLLLFSSRRLLLSSSFFSQGAGALN